MLFVATTLEEKSFHMTTTSATYSHNNPPPISTTLTAKTPLTSPDTTHKNIEDVTFAEAIVEAFKKAGVDYTKATFDLSVKGEKSATPTSPLVNKYTGQLIDVDDPQTGSKPVRESGAVKVTKTASGSMITLEIAVKIWQPADKTQTIIIKKPLYTNIKVPEHPTPQEIEGFNKKIQLVIMGQRCELQEAFNCEQKNINARVQSLINHTIECKTTNTNQAPLKVKASLYELRGEGSKLYLSSLKTTIDLTSKISSKRWLGVGKFHDKAGMTKIECDYINDQLQRHEMLRKCFLDERSILAAHSEKELDEKMAQRKQHLAELAQQTADTAAEIKLVDACKKVYGSEKMFIQHQQRLIHELSSFLLHEPTQLKSLEVLCDDASKEKAAISPVEQKLKAKQKQCAAIKRTLQKHGNNEKRKKAADMAGTLDTEIKQLTDNLKPAQVGLENKKKAIAVVNQSRLENERMLIDVTKLLLVVAANKSNEFSKDIVEGAKQTLQELQQCFIQNPPKGNETYFNTMKTLQEKVEKSLKDTTFGTASKEPMEELEQLGAEIGKLLNPIPTP